MTIDELREKLNELEKEGKLDRFIEDFGGENRTVEDIVREYTRNPEFEFHICYLLGLKTEDEKLTESALRSAKAAESSAQTAKNAIYVSVVAASAAIAAAIVAFLKN